MSTTETPTTNPNAPTHIAYQVREGTQTSYWTRIGAAWPHADSKGFTIQLDSIPLDGKISLRIPSTDE